MQARAAGIEYVDVYLFPVRGCVLHAAHCALTRGGRSAQCRSKDPGAQVKEMVDYLSSAGVAKDYSMVWLDIGAFRRCRADTSALTRRH